MEEGNVVAGTVDGGKGYKSRNVEPLETGKYKETVSLSASRNVVL